MNTRTAKRDTGTPSPSPPGPVETRLAVRVQPRAARNEVTGWRGETLCIRLTAPPVEGAANAACQEFLAALLGVKRAQVRLTGGERSRDKRLSVSGLTFEEIQAKIREQMPG